MIKASRKAVHAVTDTERLEANHYCVDSTTIGCLRHGTVEEAALKFYEKAHFVHRLRTCAIGGEKSDLWYMLCETSIPKGRGSLE